LQVECGVEVAVLQEGGPLAPGQRVVGHRRQLVYDYLFQARRGVATDAGGEDLYFQPLLAKRTDYLLDMH
jgi:hypothetical protein